MTSKQYERFLDYLDTIPLSNAGEVFERFLLWEEKYQTKLYDKRIEGNSILFECVIHYFKEYGNDVTYPDEAFILYAYELHGYILKCYSGQGCFYQVLKGNQEIF